MREQFASSGSREAVDQRSERGKVLMRWTDDEMAIEQGREPAQDLLMRPWFDIELLFELLGGKTAEVPDHLVAAHKSEARERPQNVVITIGKLQGSGEGLVSCSDARENAVALLVGEGPLELLLIEREPVLGARKAQSCRHVQHAFHCTVIRWLHDGLSPSLPPLITRNGPRCCGGESLFLRGARRAGFSAGCLSRQKSRA